MVKTEERLLIYLALLITCASIGPFLGLGATLWTLVQIAVVIEAVRWIGSNGRYSRTHRSW